MKARTSKAYRVPRRKRTWIYQPEIRTFYWSRGSQGPLDGDLSMFGDRDELVEWCRQNGCVRHGIWVQCPDDETAMLFKLRWT